MSQIDISSKLGKEKPSIKIAEGKVFEINNGADTYLEFQQKVGNKKEFSIKDMYEMIETLMGEDALKEIKNMNLSIKELEVVITAISALISEVEYEEMEKRFQELKQ